MSQRDEKQEHQPEAQEATATGELAALIAADQRGDLSDVTMPENNVEMQSDVELSLIHI